MRKAAARDMRGTMSGFAFVAGMGRAWKVGLPPLPVVLPFTVDARVSEDCWEAVRRMLAVGDVGDVVPWYSQLSESVESDGAESDVSGSSVVRKGGDEAKMVWI